jgi:hypothetical protein
MTKTLKETTMTKTLLVTSACIAALLMMGSSADAKKLNLRQFYLTQTTHTGDTALYACAPGYHMASMWEILDPSNLLYNTTLGATQDDAGEGPPNDLDGWVRTGNNASGGGNAGSANCGAWTSQFEEDIGTAAELVQSGWSQGARQFAFVAPWAAFTRSCDIPNNVWCVEDVEVD